MPKKLNNHTIGAVSAGHQATAETAAQILKSGGNAFDAVVAANLTACVVEPVLASFAGGGFLLAETAGGQQTLYDFFVQTPRKIKPKSEFSFFPISADFGYAKQEFHIGPGSMATPGTVKGLFEIHRDLCSMPFPGLAEPAIKLARDGVKMNSFQAGAIQITEAIYASNKEASKIFRSRKKDRAFISEGEWLTQPRLADFIEELAMEGESYFYDGEVADKICRICEEEGGHLTREDLVNYRVEKRDPLHLEYRDSSLSMNPPPSSGGLLIAFALKLMESLDRKSFQSFSELLVEVQEMTNRARIENIIENDDPNKFEEMLHAPFIEMYKKQVQHRRKASRGTTQISIVDTDGNMASLTTSNGSGSGVMIPGTGVMMNNMLGEEDLNPVGFYNWPADQRISSMMAPAIIQLRDGKKVVLGSGGSNRIRTAILQVLLNLIDNEMDLKEAIQAPRIHFENDFLNIEKGFSEEIIAELSEKYPNHKIWEKGNLFFGGVHAVSVKEGHFSGFGDPRRGGVSILL
ncbi:gamma-glutamyltransferase [Rhodohalobacter sulfatireducens]|uniref:Glutathione hydrolase proenzyme n=1 Tax=Rhodohalobacter sulfatireducens TaxID=2911366 RepID=A0ABS9KAW5_9BACT|nr:gamma-glutamyltransferase [Rhodohalobacter sulfatireducens]